MHLAVGFTDSVLSITLIFILDKTEALGGGKINEIRMGRRNKQLNEREFESIPLFTSRRVTLPYFEKTSSKSR